MSKKKDTYNQTAIRTSIGGQALIEGIMMRGPKLTAMAVRNTKGEIVIEKEPTTMSKHKKVGKIPFVRGIFNFVDSMRCGYKYLMRSAQLSGLEEAEAELAREKEEKKRKKAGEAAAEEISGNPVDPAGTVTATSVAQPTEEAGAAPSADNAMPAPDGDGAAAVIPEPKKENSPLSVLVMVLGVVFGVGIAVGLFVILPTLIYKGFAHLIPGLQPAGHVALTSLYKSLIEGIARILLLVGYMAAVSLMKDIRRTFQYHGAEHKTIFCYEHGLPLTVENVRKQRRFHPRCGTSFLILMALVGIFISFLIDPLYYLISGSDAGMPLVLRWGIKLLLIPLIVGIGYELIKFAGRHDNLLTRIISAPGLWLQRLTVYEPDDSMNECAIAAVKEVIPDDGSDRL